MDINALDSFLIMIMNNTIQILGFIKKSKNIFPDKYLLEKLKREQYCKKEQKQKLQPGKR